MRETVPMEIRRAMPVIKTDQPVETRRFYEGILGFRVAMDEDGMLMLASTSTPTTQVIVAWPSETAVDPLPGTALRRRLDRGGRR
jgi:catechol 2,3-dioxygenase-like lactoylglutathione lyase family enzyme